MNYLSGFLFSILILVLSNSIVYSQNLVKFSKKVTGTNSFFWYHEISDNYFAAVEYTNELDSKRIDYTLLDSDIETGKYFWIENKNSNPLPLAQLSGDKNVQLLWENSHIALVKVKYPIQFSKTIGNRFEVTRVNFRARTNADYTNFIPDIKYNYTEKKAIIDAIIDSVSIDQILNTEEHITGEEPFWLNGQLDSIQTRYSYSPQIHKAKDYLQSRFQNYGYTVEYLPFALGTFYDVQFSTANPNQGWIISTDKIFGTSDGGNSWSVQYEGINGGDYWSVFAYDQNLAFAVGEYGFVMRTTDGQSWQQMTTPTSAFLFGVHFQSPTLGWICGDTGLILKTTDGGASWNTVSTPISDRLYDITFINDSTGWAVGRSGRIIKTTNYGDSWTSQSTPTSNRLYGVYFKDENEGFAVGWYGTVLHTTNGGTTWSSMTVPLNNYFYDIDFIDQYTGMIVGWDGACLVTTNGGSSWTSAGNIFQKDVYGFDLINANEAWASGSGIVARSTNFGTNWTDKLDSIPSGALINLVASKIGTTYPDQHYIVCAHYDDTSNNPAVRAPGADDNGSGTSTVLEAARVLADYDFKYSIKFVLFPGEEQGLHGSEAYAAHAASTGEQIQGVLNMDMIAYDGNGDGLVEIHAGNMSSSQALGTFLVSNVSTFGLNLTTEYKTSTSSSASDHASFWSYGFPAIMHIEDFQDFTPFYHTTNDLISTFNIPYFHENAKLTIGSLALLAQLDTSVTSVPDNGTYPDNFILAEPYPNPFNPLVNIEYTLNKSAEVTLNIYDILGRNIQNLVNGYQPAGDYKYSWTGKNSENQDVASGIYLLKVSIPGYNLVKKLVLIR